MAFTSCVWPWKVFRGRSQPSLQTWMVWSVEQLANEQLSFQSTSRAGAEWKANCWVHWPTQMHETSNFFDRNLSKLEFLDFFQDKDFPNSSFIDKNS
uniref:Uncharacterized protein n=1 Tax=Romanomermis culicivorax TaxID=13658 RepID=A0A915KDI5_ROMCU